MVRKIILSLCLKIAHLSEGEFKYKIMETIIVDQRNSQTMHQKLQDLLVAISWADLSRTYFGKSSSWLYHKMDGRDGNGKPTSFTKEEAEI